MVRGEGGGVGANNTCYIPGSAGVALTSYRFYFLGQTPLISNRFKSQMLLWLKNFLTLKNFHAIWFDIFVTFCNEELLQASRQERTRFTTFGSPAKRHPLSQVNHNPAGFFLGLFITFLYRLCVTSFSLKPRDHVNEGSRGYQAIKLSRQNLLLVSSSFLIVPRDLRDLSEIEWNFGCNHFVVLGKIFTRSVFLIRFQPRNRNTSIWSGRPSASG